MQKRTGKIVNGKCTNCGSKIIRPYDQDPTMEYYAINIINGNKTTKGICKRCRAELELPVKVFNYKYILQKVSGGSNENIHQGD